MAKGKRKQVKIKLPFGNQNAEWVWADPVGRGEARISNTPFFAGKVHNGDVVAVKKDRHGDPVVARVTKRSGNKTALVRFDADSTHKDRVAVGKVLKRHRAVAWEWGSPGLLGATIRPGTDTRRLEDDLDRILPVDDRMVVNGDCGNWGWALAGGAALLAGLTWYILEWGKAG